MSRGLKILLALLAALLVVLVLNAIAVSNETADAERNVEGAELIDTSSGTLQVLSEGAADGSPIVLLHGYTASLRWYDELAALLAEDHRVIRVDLLGHGGSDKPGTGYAIEDQAQAVAEALARLEVTDATAVGHSMGLTVATALAEQSPELATRVVNIDQAPDDSYEDISFTEKLGHTPVIGQAMKRVTDVAPNSVVRDQYQRAFAPDFNTASGFENPDQVVDDLQEMTYTAFIDAADAEGDYSDARPLDERLATLEIPVLVIFGTEDQTYDPEDAIEPYRDIPGAQLELIEGSGHSPQVEQPEQVAALISAFTTPPEPAPLPGEKKQGAGKKNKGNSKQQKAASG